MITKRKAKDGTISWQVRSRAGAARGRRVYVGSFGNERLAKQALQEHEVKQRAIERGELPPELDHDRLFTQASDEWIESLKRGKSRSWDIYRKRLDLYVLPELGPTAVTKVRKPHIMGFRDRLAQKYAPATVNGILTCVSSAFSYFLDRQWIAANPCDGVAPVENPHREHNYIRTTEEITRLLAGCAAELRDMIVVAVGTGMRLDELLHLQWADVDIAGRLIQIHRGRKGTTKSGKLRRVPILDSVLPTLRERALQRGGALLVFPGKEGKVRAKQGVRPIFKLALKRAGLDVTLRWHDLRHSFAVAWVSSGGDIFRLSKLLGHADVKITARLYADYAPEAFAGDYHRVAFTVPTERPNLYALKRDEAGKIVGRGAVALVC